jgi:exodeoxyribonuclease V gamma subunit
MSHPNAHNRAMLTVHYSNRLETLAAELAAVTRSPLASPFASETVVVQSRGVARWLALSLAELHGVCANVRFPFPNAFAWELYRSAYGDEPEQSTFDPDVLSWRILGVLPELEALPAFAPVSAYVRGDALRRYDLAVRLAAHFDEYLVYRPDWIAGWERKEPGQWQGILWRRLARASRSRHRAALQAKFVLALASGELPCALPERISVFGAPALAPALIELFTGLGRHSDVHLFVQNPCREYWGDIAGEGDIARRKLKGRAEAGYLETGNSLLASLGKQGRDFIDLVGANAGEGVRERDCYVEPGRGSLLASIQSDVLELSQCAAGAERSAVAADDCSLQIHSAHSAMREVEVLHDQLLALLSRWPELQPSDVVVMTPDIEQYAPYIEAVFATAEPQIPFNISDRSAEQASTLAATLMGLLELHGSRYEAGRVLAPLDDAAVRRRYGFSEGDVESVRRWVREAQIRWGIDAPHRARFGLPATYEHTWRFGIERLLLGYALPAGNERLFKGVLPYDEVEGSLAEILGRFASYAEAAIALETGLSGSHPVDRWCERLHEVIAGFFDPAFERAEELEAVRSVIGAIEREARSGHFAAEVPFAVVLAALRERLEVPGRAFLSGGVTFCAMVPMRSLPFDIVCMIGLNNGAFPRMRRREGFDLMADDFRKGDRSRRDDDRYLFLESLSSARRCLYVSYTGRHIREDTPIPPSVLVSELLDYIARGYVPHDGGDIRERLVTQHPLQAFSPRYFRGGGRLFSYSASLARAATTAGRGTRLPQPFVAERLPAPDAAFRQVDLDTLVRFFRNPARYLFEHRLKVKLETADEELESSEPFELAGLPLFRLKDRLLEMRLRGETPDGLELARAGGLLPHGAMGTALFAEQSAVVERVAEAALKALPAETEAPRRFDVASEHVVLSGALTHMGAEGMVTYRVAKASAHVRVSAWIHHLALNAFAPRNVARVSRCIAQDCVLTYASVDGARERLIELLELYWSGLHSPLHFFPRTACEYAKSWEIGYKVRTVWMGSFPDNRGERDDPYFALAFRGVDPLNHAFEACARTLFEPMTASLTEEPLA